MRDAEGPCGEVRRSAKPPPYPLVGGRPFHSLPPEYRWREGCASRITITSSHHVRTYRTPAKDEKRSIEIGIGIAMGVLEQEEDYEDE